MISHIFFAEKTINIKSSQNIFLRAFNVQGERKTSLLSGRNVCIFIFSFMVVAD
jgi:hypothetical protein